MIFLLLLSTLSSDMILERDVRHESNFPIPLHYSTIFYLRAFWGVPQLRHKNKHLKGVFAKNERGYRLNAIKKRF